VELCSEVDERFKELANYADCLTPYATAFRYPGVDLDPDIDDVKEAISMAETILDFVKNKVV
jgi:HEPN domain-containing protein